MNIDYCEFDAQYAAVLRQLISKAKQNITKDRTGAGRARIFSVQMRLDLRNEFPLLQLKKTHFSSIVKELAWFGMGSTNIKDLNCSIWDEWSQTKTDHAVPQGEIGPMYGNQWRRAVGKGPNGVTTQEDQLSNVIQIAKTNPFSSRLIVDSWDPNKLPRPYLTVEENIDHGYMALAPCHFAYQFFCEEEDGVMYMDLKYHARSQDWLLGTPFNVASYALLLLLVAKQLGYTARFLIPDMGDCHIYGNHLGENLDKFIEQSIDFWEDFDLLLDQDAYVPVTVEIPDGVTIFNLHEHVDEVVNGLKNYNPKPHIKFARN